MNQDRLVSALKSRYENAIKLNGQCSANKKGSAIRCSLPAKKGELTSGFHMRNPTDKGHRRY